jgi:drug/metabolite transporter (DMT)-like permease
MKYLGRGALFLTTLIWGASFVLMDIALDSVPTLLILAVRFSGAAVILFLIGFKELKKIDKKYLGGGVLMGVLLLTSYIFQTYGLTMTTPGKNAFLTAAYCVIVPFVSWFAVRKKPDKYNVLAAFVCIAGIGFISLQSNLTVGLGDVLSLVCGFFFALHIIACGHYIEGRSPILLAMIQFATAGVISWAGTLLFESFPSSIPLMAGLDLAFLTVMATALCLSLQIFGQKHTPAAQASVIMTFESVFGAAASILFYGEALTPKLLTGFVLTFAAVLISETKLSFLKRRNREKEPIA